jgi:hypothetical protein
MQGDTLMTRITKDIDADALAAKIKFISYSRDIYGMLAGWRRIYKAIPASQERAHAVDFAGVMFEELHELGGHQADRVKRIVPMLRDAITGKRDPSKTSLECGEIVFDVKMSDLKDSGIDIKVILG